MQIFLRRYFKLLQSVGASRVSFFNTCFRLAPVGPSPGPLRRRRRGRTCCTGPAPPGASGAAGRASSAGSSSTRRSTRSPAPPPPRSARRQGWSGWSARPEAKIMSTYRAGKKRLFAVSSLTRNGFPQHLKSWLVSPQQNTGHSARASPSTMQVSAAACCARSARAEASSSRVILAWRDDMSTGPGLRWTGTRITQSTNLCCCWASH